MPSIGMTYISIHCEGLYQCDCPEPRSANTVNPTAPKTLLHKITTWAATWGTWHNHVHGTTPSNTHAAIQQPLFLSKLPFNHTYLSPRCQHHKRLTLGQPQMPQAHNLNLTVKIKHSHPYTAGCHSQCCQPCVQSLLWNPAATQCHMRG